MRRPTVVSIDGVGAFDLIFRNAMLQALLEIDGGGPDHAFRQTTLRATINTFVGG